MIASTKHALDLLAECEATANNQRDPNRVGDILLQHRKLREALQQQLQYAEGFEAEHHRLIGLVHELLGTVTASTNGRAEWISELPDPGRAPAFRRALNKTIAYLRGDNQ